jgi:Na+/phosphate symporter
VGGETGGPGRLGRLLRQAKANAREHPYMTVLFAFWAFGYTIMVPQILGSNYLPFVSEQMGGRPEAMFVAFAMLMVNVVLFALAVPFALWMLICWALRKED